MKTIGGVLMLMIALNSSACDICNMSVSLTPDDTKNYISVLYRKRCATRTFNQLVYVPTAIESIDRHSGVILLPGLEEQTHTEIYSVYEIRGVYNFSNRISVFTSIPIIHNKRMINGDKQFDVKGLGDPIVIGKYNLIRTNHTDDNKANHRVTLGTGIKFPLGKYNFQHNGRLIEHDIQAGTGTVDFLFSFDYILKYKKTGLMFNSNYKVNTMNRKVDYMFGNSLNSTATFFYMQPLSKSITLLPYLGTYIENAQRDIESKQYEINTGGTLLFGTAGLQIFVNQFSLEAMYQQTFENNLNGSLQLNTRNRFQLALTYLFK